MAQIILNIPNPSINRVLDAFASKYGWTADSGVTKAEFAKNQLARFIKETVIEQEGDLQSGQLRSTIRAEIDNVTIN